MNARQKEIILTLTYFSSKHEYAISEIIVRDGANAAALREFMRTAPYPIDVMARTLLAGIPGTRENKIAKSLIEGGG